MNSSSLASRQTNKRTHMHSTPHNKRNQTETKRTHFIANHLVLASSVFDRTCKRQEAFSCRRPRGACWWRSIETKHTAQRLGHPSSPCFFSFEPPCSARVQNDNQQDSLERSSRDAPSGLDGLLSQHSPRCNTIFGCLAAG